MASMRSGMASAFMAQAQGTRINFNPTKDYDPIKGKKVVLHEFGHTVGLGHSDGNNVMHDTGMAKTKATAQDYNIILSAMAKTPRIYSGKGG